MKSIRTSLFCLLSLCVSLCVLAQRPPTSVAIANTAVPTQEQGRDAILFREGDGIDLSRDVSAGTGQNDTLNAVVNWQSKVVPYGFQAKVRKVIITTDGAVSLTGQIRIGNGSGGNEKAVTPLTIISPSSGGRWEFDLDETLYGGGHILLVTQQTTSTRPRVRMFATGRMMTDDRHYNAPFVHAVFGNSISWGTLGNRALGGAYPNPGKTHFARRINSALRLAGIDVRPSMRGFGGSQARDWMRQIDSGLYDDQPIDLAEILLGTNEAADGDSSLVEASSGMKYSQMMEYIIDWVYSRNANASVVILGAPHSSTTPRITNLPSLRAATARLVTLAKYAGKDLKYYDTSANIPAPTVVNDANYVETGLGKHIHLRGDTGHALIYQGLWPIIQQTKFYTNNVKLSKPLDP